MTTSDSDNGRIVIHDTALLIELRVSRELAMEVATTLEEIPEVSRVQLAPSKIGDHPFIWVVLHPEYPAGNVRGVITRTLSGWANRKGVDLVGYDGRRLIGNIVAAAE